MYVVLDGTGMEVLRGTSGDVGVAVTVTVEEELAGTVTVAYNVSVVDEPVTVAVAMTEVLDGTVMVLYSVSVPDGPVTVAVTFSGGEDVIFMESEDVGDTVNVIN